MFVAKRMRKQESFRIVGLDCAEEVRVLRGELSGLPGIDLLEFDILRGRMSVVFDDAKISLAEIVQSVSQTGMQARPWSEAEGSAAGPWWLQHNRLLMSIASGVALVTGFAWHAIQAGNVAAAAGVSIDEQAPIPAGAYLAYSLSIVAGIWFVAPRAWGAIQRLRPDMHLLMCVAVVGAIALGDWFEAASVTFLFAVAQLLEHWSMDRSRRAIAKLLDLSPRTARMVDPVTGTEVDVPVAQVAVGSVLRARPHEKIALDGVVLAGETTVDEAPLTGESMPVSKQSGDSVFAGTVNQAGVIEYRVSKQAGETTLARIVQMVEEAHARRAPSEQWVQVFAKYYTPAMMGLALLLAIGPPLLLPGWEGEWSESVYRGLVVLVIACPCALVISTPVTVVSAITAAARHGVLIKGGLYLERCAHLKALAVDKTGTLTCGRPEVQTLLPLNGHSPGELLQRAAALEAHSNHPIARAILRAATEHNLTVSPATAYRVLNGRGAEGEFDGRRFWIGSQRFMREKNAETPEVQQQALSLEDAGHTIVAIGNSEHVCGLIGVADAVRERVVDALRELRDAGIEQIVMLTGDNARTAAAIAALTGIDTFRADLLPEDKVQVVVELRKRAGSVAMVGDGVNDAPAMAAADVGISMAAMGSDAAIETSDIALMSDELPKVGWLILHSRRALSVVRQNILFALGTKGAFLALNLLGAASLWSAIAADMGASLLVIFNGLRLLRR